MHTLSSEEEITRLLKDRPELTQTYEVTGELAGQVPLDAVGLRRMDESELRELAEYLGVGVEYLRGPFRVIDAECPRCGRRVTFLDFVKTAVDKGVHDRTELGAILTGEARNWITIRGRDGGRPVSCARCQQALRMFNGYSEYSSSNYAYA
jgi:uncharacterized C2H2 Zn-finger protein